MQRNVLHFQKTKVVEGNRGVRGEGWGQRVIFAVPVVLSKLKENGASVVQV